MKHIKLFEELIDEFGGSSGVIGRTGSNKKTDSATGANGPSGPIRQDDGTILQDDEDDYYAGIDILKSLGIDDEETDKPNSPPNYREDWDTEGEYTDNRIDPFNEEDWDEKDVDVDIADYLEKNLYSDTKHILDNNDRLVYISDVIKVVKKLLAGGTHDAGPK